MVSECMIATLPLQCVLDFHTLVHQVRFQTSPQPRPHALEVRSLSSVIRCFHFPVQKRANMSSTTRLVRSSSILTLQFLVPRKGRIIRGGFLLIRKRRKRIKLHNQHRVIGFWEGATESDESSWLQERRRMEQRSLSYFLFSVPCRYQSPVCTM